MVVRRRCQTPAMDTAPRIGSLAREGRAPATGDLAGRRILVIGGGQDDRGFPDDAPVGNGRAISVLAARHGATVTVTDLVAERAAGTAALARAEGEALTLVYPPREIPGIFRGESCTTCPAFGERCEGIERSWSSDDEWDDMLERVG